MSDISFFSSPEAKAAPHNVAASLAVEFKVVAEKEVLACFHAFCTFLGKTHEAGVFSSWSVSDDGIVPCFTQPCESLGAPEGEAGAPSEAGQLVSVSSQLLLPPFSVPASFCEQLLSEPLSFTVVRTAEAAPEGPQGPPRKEPQAKGPPKGEGKERSPKRGGAPRPLIPNGETRTADMPAAPLLILKSEEHMQAPEDMQQTLATLPGIVSFEVKIKTLNSLLSPELRRLLNPVWLLIKDVCSLPPPCCRISPETNSTTNINSTNCVAAEKEAPLSAAAFKGPAVDTPQDVGPGVVGDASSSNDSSLYYFSRIFSFSQVFETPPKAATPISDTNSVCWNAGFITFWGPCAADQNKLKDFIEEQTLQVELYATADYPDGASPSDLASLLISSDAQKQTAAARGPLKQQKSNPSALKKRRPTSKSQRARGESAESSSHLEAPHPSGSNGGAPLAGGGPFPLLGGPLPRGPPVRPPYGLASFRLSALSSCKATHLSFCTDVIPVIGYRVRRGQAGEVLSVRKAKGPDFIGSGTRMTVEIRLAEPLFLQTIPILKNPKITGETQEGKGCLSFVPNQKINRIFLSAPLQSRVAAEVEKIREREAETTGENSACQLAERDEKEEARDILTGFLVQDGRLLYAVLEGLAEGRLAGAAALLLAACSEGEEERGKVLYNSRLRFSERRYPLASSLQKLELVVPVAELATSRAVLETQTAEAQLIASAISKLQMATLFSRAADLKCQDLFPTNAELQSIKQFTAVEPPNPKP